MFVWFKKRIATDTSGEDARRITNISKKMIFIMKLEQNGCEGLQVLAIDSRYHARINQPLYKGSRQLSYVYMIYVRRKDYDRAYDLIF